MFPKVPSAKKRDQTHGNSSALERSDRLVFFKSWLFNVLFGVGYSMFYLVYIMVQIEYRREGY